MPLTATVVHHRLHSAARRYRRVRAWRYLLSGGAAALFVLALFLIGDAQFHFGAAGRWIGFCLMIAALAGGLAAALRAWWPGVSEASMARRIETSCAGGSGGGRGASNALISAVQFDRELPEDSGLRRALFEEMEDPFPRVRWAEVFHLQLLRRLGIALAAAALLVAGWAALRPAAFANSAARVLLPAAPIAPLTRTQIASLTPGDAQIVHGKDLVVSAKFRGEMPRTAWLVARAPGGGWQRELMDHETGRAEFRFTRKEVREPLEYRVEAGDARSPVYHVAVRPRTAIRAHSAEIEPPAYTHLGKQTLREFAALPNILPGSKIAVTFEFNHPLAELRAASEPTQTPPLTVEKIDEVHWRLSGKIMSSRAVRLDYRDTDGLSDSDALSIAVQPDEPPKLNVTEPAEGRELFAARDATLTIRFTASDNFALGSLALYRGTAEKPDAQLVQAWKEAAGQREFTARAAVALRNFAGADDDRATFCVVARDQNDVSGPGVTISRPIVVLLRSAGQIRQQNEEAARKIQRGLEDLIKQQTANLEATRLARTADNPPAGTLLLLLDAQVKIGAQAADLAASTEDLAPEIRADLRALGDKEMKDAVLALRDAAGASAADARAGHLARAATLEAAILARLQGGPAAAEASAKAGQIQDLIAGVDDLLRREREIHRDTNAASSADPAAARSLAGRQDALAEQTPQVRQTLEAASKNAALGDENFRARLAKIAALFGELRLYEDMLAAAEKLEVKSFPAAAEVEKRVVVNLARIVEMLNQWQLASAGERAGDLHKKLDALREKLDRLEALQRGVVEKSKDLARKDQFDPKDQAVATEIRETKEQMKQLVEQMLTDAHVFPDLKPANELRAELTSIFEDVQQADKDAAAQGKLQPQEIAVQKEDGLLQDIEKAKQIAADMEMWLPNANEMQKWLLENFDKAEMPDIPNLPLPDAFEDIVGKLLDEQQNLADQVQDAASNQAFAQNAANGWEIRDGPMPGFGAQGKSGNERPNHNEQTGRSSGGREGMSDGEMAGDTASNLEGDRPDARRTNDPLQNGEVKDAGGPARATGGGKSGGSSNQAGMDGNAPLRTVNAPPAAAADALAAKQALLAEKTSKAYAAASLLYLRTGPLPEITRLMTESEAALREGRARDFASLHQRIAGRLKEARDGATSGAVVSLPAGGAARVKDKALLGGDEGQAPAAYRDAVADYYRALVEEK